MESGNQLGWRRELLESMQNQRLNLWRWPDSRFSATGWCARGLLKMVWQKYECWKTSMISSAHAIFIELKMKTPEHEQPALTPSNTSWPQQAYRQRTTGRPCIWMHWCNSRLRYLDPRCCRGTPFCVSEWNFKIKNYTHREIAKQKYQWDVGTRHVLCIQ